MILPSFPNAFDVTDETNPFLRKYKNRLKKRLTLSRMEGLFDEVDLAYYLTALDRYREALSVTTFLSNNVEFTGNYNIWSPIGYGLCLQARLHRLLHESVLLSEDMELIELHPVYVVEENSIEADLIYLVSQLEQNYSNSSSKWSCQGLARTLYNLCYYREARIFAPLNTGVPGFYNVEQFIVDGFYKLKTRLEMS